MGYILSGEELRRYAETRLFGKNVTPEMVKRIELHNGILPSELLTQYAKQGINPDRVEQENPREPIYYHEGALLIPQYSGFARARRYRRLIKRYCADGERDILFTEHDNDGSVATNMAYENYAYDFVKKLSSQEPFTEIKAIILGNTTAVARQAPTLSRYTDEYLDAIVLDVNGRRAINYGYLYGDQAGIIINKFLRHWDGQRKHEKSDSIGIYAFGRFGSLDDKTERHDLVRPTRLMNEHDLKREKVLIYPVDNCFAPTSLDCLNLNVGAVVDETSYFLRRAKEYGARTVDMELFEMSMAINQARERYSRDGEDTAIEFGLLGHVSDKPLHGDTLADELDSDAGEYEAIAEILEHIAQL